MTEASLEELEKRLAIFEEVAREINVTLDLRDILHGILRAMDTTFGFRHSMIFLLDDDGETLRVAASRGFGDSEAGVGAEVKVGQGVVGIVAKRRKLMRMGGIAMQRAYVAAVQKQSGGGFEEIKVPGLPNVQSQVAIPLVNQDRLVGVFAIESEQPSVFDARDEAIITTLSHQAASAIEKARLHAELKKHSENLEETVRARTADLRRAQAQLVQSEKMAALGLLVAGIAHEINTPMGAIASTLDTVFRAVDKLRAKATPEDTRIFTILDGSQKVLTDATTRVSAIVRRLKSFARLDEAELKETDLHSDLEDTLALVAYELGTIRVVKDFSPLPRVLCQGGRLNQVFLNLIVNARQAIGTKPDGEIRIATRAEGDRVKVAITDNGSGIAKEHLARVFDPGFTTKGVGVGTGLGLSICYQIVQDHAGTITIESEVGRGTTVTVDVPVRRA